jgi:hypothetical protein
MVLEVLEAEVLEWVPEWVSEPVVLEEPEALVDQVASED